MIAVTIGVGLAVAGCRSSYYRAWEMLGQEKRDLLQRNVEQVRDDQEKASEDFRDTLELLMEITETDGGELEKLYGRLESRYERSADRAGEIEDRVDEIDRLATDLFAEWEAELEQISSARLRARSREQLAASRKRYRELESALATSVASMDPVLERFRDQVLYLKHNLNARVLADLDHEAVELQGEIEALIADLERSIEEADRFIRQME